MSDLSFQGVVRGITQILRRVPDRQVFARRNASEWPLLASSSESAPAGSALSDAAVSAGVIRRAVDRGSHPVQPWTHGRVDRCSAEP